MTKARARGPKRRAPTKAEGSDVPEVTSKNTLSVKETISSSPGIKRIPSPKLPETPLKPSSKPSTPSKPLDLVSKFSPKVETPPSQKTEKVKPLTPAKSPLLRATSASNLRDAAQSPIAKLPSSERALSLPEPSVLSAASSLTPRISSKEGYSASSSQRSSAIPSLDEKDEDGPASIVKNATATWGRSLRSSGISKQTSFFSKRNGEGLAKEDSLSPLEAPRSSESDPSRIFGKFFTGPSRKMPKLDLDVSGILSAGRTGPVEEVKSLKTELSEITGYGKLQPVPQEYENVLFDESMYVCVHTYKTPLGAKGTEVYLWSGDKVSEPAVEDALLFARKMAREHDGKLVGFSQDII